MAAKRFHIATPEQMKALCEFVKDGNLSRTASVWSATHRREGKTRWDQAIYACFSGDRSKEAEVVRLGSNEEIVHCARLKYNLALSWCESHLRQID